MKASTHTEIYRPFRGQLSRHPRRSLILASSAVRLGVRKRLPALLLFAVPAISCIVTSFVVHVSFTTEIVPGLDAERAAMVQAMAGRLLAVENLILLYIEQVRWFALLAIAWYGSGLIAEDRRLGAHLLYFSRPLTRFHYVLGKFLAASFFGACALLFPTLVICSVASFSSPDWSFLLDRWDVILKAVAFTSLWIVTLSAVVLAVSSVVERKTLALVGIFGLVIMTDGAAAVLAELTNDPHYRLLSLPTNFERIGHWLFDRPTPYAWSVEASLWVVGALVAVSLLVLARRVRRMEIVA